MCSMYEIFQIFIFVQDIIFGPYCFISTTLWKLEENDAKDKQNENIRV